MKAVTILSLLLLTSAAFGELTKQDLHDLKEDLHKVIKEESAASEKRTREHIDLKIETVNTKIDAVEKSLNARIDATNTRIDALEQSLNAKIGALDKRMDNMWHLMMALFGLVAATIAIPQIIIAYRDRGRKEMQTEIEQLRERLEALENTPS